MKGLIFLVVAVAATAYVIVGWTKDYMDDKTLLDLRDLVAALDAAPESSKQCMRMRLKDQLDTGVVVVNRRQLEHLEKTCAGTGN